MCGSNFLMASRLRQMFGRPELLLYYVPLVAKRYRAEGRDVEIYADSLVSLNFRPKQRLIDPTVDLAAEPNSLMPYPWLTEFEDTPMRNTVPPVHSHLDATARRLARRAGPPGTLAPPVLAPRRIDFR